MALTKGTQFSRSNFHWSPGIVAASQPVLVRDYPDRLADMIRKKLIQRGIIDTMECSVMNYAWTRLSYIPWHNDEHRKDAVTVFPNREWDRNMGGLFLYETEPDGTIQAMVPRFNCALRNSGHILHATTPVYLEAPEPRFTIQLFSRG